ncbi:hypothetical protein Q604_UNBC01732G0001, partial [human gut metagenome]
KKPISNATRTPTITSVHIKPALIGTADTKSQNVRTKPKRMIPNTMITDFVLISVSIRCNSRSAELLFMDLTEIFIPSMIGLINVIKVQIAAIPIAPACG